MLLARRYSARANVRWNTKNTLTESCGQNARPGLGQGLRCLFFFPQFVLLQFLKLRNGRMLWFLRTSGFFFPKIGVCFSNLRQFPKLLKLEFVEYTPTARDTEGSLSENRITAVPRWSSHGNVLSCLFVRVVVNVVVLFCYKQFEVNEVRVAQEILSQFYSDVKGSNSVLRLKSLQRWEQFCENKQIRNLRDDHREIVARFCFVLIVLRRRFLRDNHWKVELSESSMSLGLAYIPRKNNNFSRKISSFRKTNKNDALIASVYSYFFFNYLHEK